MITLHIVSGVTASMFGWQDPVTLTWRRFSGTQARALVASALAEGSLTVSLSGRPGQLEMATVADDLHVSLELLGSRRAFIMLRDGDRVLVACKDGKRPKNVIWWLVDVSFPRREAAFERAA